MGIHDGHREKMRRRFRETGLEGFADHEALELLLYYAIPRRDTNPIAHALMDRYDSLSAVLNAPVEDLQKVEGIGESAAVLLSLVARISRKARLADAAQETVPIPPSGRAPTCWSDSPARPGSRSICCAWTGRRSCWPASGWRTETWPAPT